MSQLTRQKLEQASALVAPFGFDAWITFVRETSGVSDPCLPFLIEGGLTWQSALIVSASGKRVAVVGNYDAQPLEVSGDWDAVMGYVQSIVPPLLAALEELIPTTVSQPRIAVNFSESDDKADGLTYGMYRLLESYLVGTRFAGALVSAERLVCALRGRKTEAELAAIRSAIVETDALFVEFAAEASVGKTEKQLYDFVHARMHERSLGFSWDPEGDPIVNCGPDSPSGHAAPTDLALAAGHLLHIDLGVIKNGYASDLQRCWFVGEAVPPRLQHAFDAVAGAIQAGFDALKPGKAGWEIDAVARAFVVEAGYPEYLHALGHQVGRVAHDGGGLLGPRWERYGETPSWPIEVGQVYTLELGVRVEGHGYLSLEEMVLVTESGAQWLSTPQKELWLLP